MSYLTELGIHDYRDALETLSETTGALKGFSALLDSALLQGGGDLKPESSGIISLLGRQIEDIEALQTFLRTEFSRIQAEKLKITDVTRIASMTGASSHTVLLVAQLMLGINLSKLSDDARGTEEEDAVMDFLADTVDNIPVDDLRRVLFLRFNENAALSRIGHLLNLSEDQVFTVLKYAISPNKLHQAEIAATKATQGATIAAHDASVREMRDAFIRSQAAEGADAAAIAQALNLKKATVERVIGQLLARAEPQSEDAKKAVNE